MQLPNDPYASQTGPRSKSNNVEMRHSKKEDFKLRMDDKVTRLRRQGLQVEGFVKLHKVFL